MIGNLLAALAGPKLDAACVGLWEMFDPAENTESATDVAYRHGAAIALCADCPALDDCRGWVESLPARDRPAGVIAGMLLDAAPPRRRKGAA